MPEALSGVRVLEVGGGIAAAFGARLLGDFGADVVKLEPPGTGDSMRHSDPWADELLREGLFEYLNWNKRSVELDLGDPASASASAATWRSLVEAADVLVSGFRPGRLQSRAIVPAVLREWNPRLAVVSVSPFGHDGPYADLDAGDLVLQAMSGLMQISGSTDREPLKRGLRQSHYTAGINVAYTAILGYLQASTTGLGAEVDISMHEVIASEGVTSQPLYAFIGAVQGRRQPINDPLDGHPIRCADGYATFQATALVPVARIAEILREPRLAEDRFATRERRAANAAELRGILEEHTLQMSGRELFEFAMGAGMLAGFVQDAAGLLACPHLAEREAWANVTGPTRTWKLPVGLARMSLTPHCEPGRAPRLGEHNDQVRDTWGQRRPERPLIQPVRAAAHDTGARPGPLSGLRVLDLSTVFAMPYLTALLADMGAEVVKIEAPRRLDQARVSWGACFDNDPSADPWNRFSTFQVLQRGKGSLALDLSAPEGRQVLAGLVAKSDVLVEAFSPRVMPRWGFSYPQLAAINPGLIMVSNSGYGATGPWSAFRAQGTTLEATMGLTNYSGYRDGPPTKAGQSYPDFLACWGGLTALMAALVHRDRTGAGQWIDLGMYQLGATVMPEPILSVQAKGFDVPRANEDLEASVSAVLPTREPDRWVAFSVPPGRGLSKLGELIPALADAGLPATVDEADRAHGILAEWSSGVATTEVVDLLRAAGIAAGPVSNARDLMLDPHLNARGFYEPVEFGHGLGQRRLIGRPYRWNAENTALAIRGPAPDFGVSNTDILRGLLGYSAEQTEDLRSRGISTDLPIDPPVVTPVEIDLLLATGEYVAVDEHYREVAR